MKRSKPKQVVRWFARGGGIERCGPFNTQAEASTAMRQVVESDSEYAWAVANGINRPQFRGGFPADVFVWPEVTES